jgi:hypothetical protein
VASVTVDVFKLKRSFGRLAISGGGLKFGGYRVLDHSKPGFNCHKLVSFADFLHIETVAIECGITLLHSLALLRSLLELRGVKLCLEISVSVWSN